MVLLPELLFSWNFSVFLNISSIVTSYVYTIISVAVFAVFVNAAGWCYGRIFSAIFRI